MGKLLQHGFQHGTAPVRRRVNTGAVFWYEGGSARISWCSTRLSE